MEKTRTKKETCPLCGKERTFEIITENGLDKDGNKVTKPYQKSTDEGCTCKFQTVATELPEIKGGCLNCASRKMGSCVNEEVLAELNKAMSNFDIELKRLKIKNMKHKCPHYTFDTTLLKDIIKVV